MEKLILFFLPLFFSCSFGDKNTTPQETSEEPTTYYFIRHAEKDISNPNNPDPELTEEGIKRSEKWAEVFRDISFDAIYSSDFKRTRNTAQKIADFQEKEVQLYDVSKLNDENFQKNTKGKTVLVVGHSNTNPAFVNYILEEKKYKDIEESESGSLFIVTLMPNGTKTSEVLYIN
ncbi:histidine phosphatase family protein [Antarcticibacterium sp. 1MA-6-2]|uniref:phosphoglycerate mutase family protein n=1 Tax=Antarcticibacterium sp. 1MA-6-2 TaxID=2908210 RepID=UPI001F2238C4|nr:phosphoglycerate mutase family protein [Antarcticibacterium sp. 1MA-6-2]UJH92266.1 histidine phosphatase family protein [Antarcticibacterium sp. 1MA-6-2]